MNAVMNHDQLVNLIFKKLDLIEKGAQSLYKNFPIHGSKLDASLKKAGKMLRVLCFLTQTKVYLLWKVTRFRINRLAIER